MSRRLLLPFEFEFLTVRGGAGAVVWGMAGHALVGI